MGAFELLLQHFWHNLDSKKYNFIINIILKKMVTMMVVEHFRRELFGFESRGDFLRRRRALSLPLGDHLPRPQEHHHPHHHRLLRHQQRPRHHLRCPLPPSPPHKQLLLGNTSISSLIISWCWKSKFYIKVKLSIYVKFFELSYSKVKKIVTMVANEAKLEP